MAEYIDRKGVRNALYAEDAITMKGVLIINSFPAADVQPVRSGVWIPMDSCMTICSECNSLGCGTKYCAACGARMKKVREE